MSDELESELERLKKQNVVSEETAKLYLSKVREKIDQEGSPEDQSE